MTGCGGLSRVILQVSLRLPSPHGYVGEGVPKVFPLTPCAQDLLSSDSFLELGAAGAHLAENIAVIDSCCFADGFADQMLTQEVGDASHCIARQSGDGLRYVSQYFSARRELPSAISGMMKLLQCVGQDHPVL